MNLNITNRVLIIDDSAIDRKLIKHSLSLHNIDCLEAQNMDSAWQIIIKEKPSLILLDIHLSEKDGTELLYEMQDEDINIPIIIITNDKELVDNPWINNPLVQKIIHKPLSINKVKYILSLDAE